MLLSYYHLLGHVFVAVHACHSQADAREMLGKVGFGKDLVERGRKLVEEGESLVTRRLDEEGEDRTIEHGLHVAVAELEMWLRSAEYLVKRKLDNAQLLELVFGHDLHAEDHTLTALARGIRALSLIRTRPDIQETLGSVRAGHDLVVTGWALLNKVLKYTKMRLAPGPLSDENGAVFAALAQHEAAMRAWVLELKAATEKMTDKPKMLGYIGFLPAGVGLPMGGAAYDVVLHQQARRAAPNPADAQPTSGWSVGRQGRNRENLGKGFIEPTFD